MIIDELVSIGRSRPLFSKDLEEYADSILDQINESKFLVIGGAGSIGRSVCKEIFYRNPKVLHVVDISENSLVELVRDLRSTKGYIDGEFKTFAIDAGTEEFYRLLRNQDYDFVLNLSALKHVRSERDEYTLSRMLDVNIFNVRNCLSILEKKNIKKYFSVSTDKAANPANLMGASKRIMELFLLDESNQVKTSLARFANVAFSDGSLLHGFVNRFRKSQPIAAPNDVKRYFISHKESGELCLMSLLYGDDLDILFPKTSGDLELTLFSDVAKNFIQAQGFEPYECETEDEARRKSKELIQKKLWPCFFFKSDTSGEKPYEEFFTGEEKLDLKLFKSLGVIKNSKLSITDKLKLFEQNIFELRSSDKWSKSDIVLIIERLVEGFVHDKVSKNLDQKM